MSSPGPGERYGVFYGGIVKSAGKNGENFVEAHKKKPAEAFGASAAFFMREK